MESQLSIYLSMNLPGQQKQQRACPRTAPLGRSLRCLHQQLLTCAASSTLDGPLHAGADSIAAEYLDISLPGQQKQQRATPARSDSGTPFALLTSAATQLPNSHSASPAHRPLAFDGTPRTGPTTSFAFPQDSRLPVSHQLSASCMARTFHIIRFAA